MKNFYLTLYAYHLCRTLSDALYEFKQEAPYLWDSLVDLGNNSLPFDRLKDLKSNLLCYEEGENFCNQKNGLEENLSKSKEQLELGTIHTEIGFKIEGTLAPFILNDTYAVDLTLWAESPAETEINVSQLKYFNPEGSLLNVNSSLGKTIWIYAEVDEDDRDCQILAEECVRELLSSTQFTYELENIHYDLFFDKLFDSLLFEFKANNPEKSNNLSDEIQILVSLNNSQNSSLYKFTKTSKDLLHLLCSYHKINYVKQQATKLYPELRKLYSNLEQKINDLPQITTNKDTTIGLEGLKQLLADTLPSSLEYSRKFRALQAQHTTIKTNIINYRSCVDNIAILDNHTPLLWQTFSTGYCEHWQQQIQIHIEYFAPGQYLFQRVTDAIGGFLQIKQTEYEREARNLLRTTEEQKEERDRKQKQDDRNRKQEQDDRDRKLENTIQTVGIATAVGSSVSGILASSYQVAPEFITNIISRTQNNNISRTQNNNISRTQNNNISRTQNNNISRTQNNSISRTQDENINPKPWKTLSFAFFTSVLLGLLAFWGTKIVLDFLSKRESKQQKRSQL
jgi:ElaB/YqjD/DUF883 family membrane-anchored ribosome-binding protein